MTHVLRLSVAVVSGVVLSATFAAVNGRGYTWVSIASAQSVSPAVYGGMHWRLIGPFRGGRALAVAGVPGNPLVFYFGAVDGGVWKTTDAGRTWKPIFDRERIASIGAIDVAPSDPNIIYVGTGEADMRSDIAYGDGMYKSSDGGRTWNHIGLDDTRHIGRIIVDPANPDRAFVAALGHAYGPNSERGVFRTTDGGRTWRKVLYENDNTGAIDLVFDPANSETIYAALWQTRRPPWNVYPPSNGPGSGLFRSTDGGDTWQRLTSGLPSRGLGRIGIAVAASDPSRLYAVIDAKAGGLYTSADSGNTWTLVNSEQRLWQRGWYFSEIAVDPKDPNVVYISDTAFYRSTDAGKHFTPIKGSPSGDDFHQLWIDPTESRRMILGSDQGVAVTQNGGESWSSWYNQPTAQLYHVIADDRFPFWAYGAQQDSGAAAVRGRTEYLGISWRDWRPVAVGGESGYIALDPHDPNVLYGSGGPVDRYDPTTAQDQDITPWLAHPGAYRQTWTVPIVASPWRARTLYFGAQVMFRTMDGGSRWAIVSPDLSRPDPGAPPNLDAPTIADNLHLGARRGVIYAIAPSAVRRSVIWAGTDDGKIWLTLDECAHWKDVTPPQLTAWSKVGIIEASWFDAGTAYAAIDRHRLDDLHPYIYRTRDFGRTWTPIASGIPVGSFVNVVRQDPEQRRLLYAGTERGLYVSFDEGGSWQSLQLNLPVTSMRDAQVKQNALVIATHGRAMWVLDDLSPLREARAAAQAANAWLFTPELARRVRPADDQGEPAPPEESAGENRADGAFIDYYLRSPVHQVTLQIVVASGAVVRRYSSAEKPQTVDTEKLIYPAFWARVSKPLSADAGMHRFQWDFHVMPATGLDQDEGPLAPPGRYTARLRVDGVSLSRPLVVAVDPRTHASTADLRAQYDTAIRIERLRVQAQNAYRAAGNLVKRLRRDFAASARARSLASSIESLAGAAPEVSPDNSVESPEINRSTLHYIGQALSALEDAVESADVAPTHDVLAGLALQREALDGALARWRSLEMSGRRIRVGGR